MDKNKNIRQIAFYGKGGIGKSTIASNLAAVYAERGLNTMMIGCDPKSDCTRNLRGDVEIPTVLDAAREKGVAKLGLTELVDGKQIDVDEIVYKGYKGALCVEAGGPEPAVGCAGRGVIVAIDLLKKMGIYDEFDLDVVIYDVLGDVVCGGFGMPLRQGLADDVFIVTSADYLSIYAANNICKGIARHASREGSPLGGIVYNVRGAIDDLALVNGFAQSVGSKVIETIPNDSTIMKNEIYAKTVIEHSPDSEIADGFRHLATAIYENKETVSPTPLSKEELAELAQRIRKKTKEEYAFKGRMGKHKPMNNKNKIGKLNIEWAKMWQEGILNAWSHQYIKKYGSITEAWNHKAPEYVKTMEHSNRAQLVEKLEQHEPGTVLDVGAGAGIFALPLAETKYVKRVVAVEPSTGMLDILKKKAESCRLTSIECINKKWEDTTTDELIELNGGKYDVVISSHALYYITDLHDALKKMNDICKGYVYLLIGTDANKDENYEKYYERIYKKPMPLYPDYACLYMVLRELDIHPNIEMLDAYAKRYVDSVEEVIDLWKDNIDGELNEDQRDAIRKYLAESDMIKEEDGRLYWEWRSKDALIYWRAE